MPENENYEEVEQIETNDHVENNSDIEELETFEIPNEEQTELMQDMIYQLEINNQYLNDIFNFLHDFSILFGVMGISSLFAYAFFKEMIKW